MTYLTHKSELEEYENKIGLKNLSVQAGCYSVIHSWGVEISTLSDNFGLTIGRVRTALRRPRKISCFNDTEILLSLKRKKN